MYHAEDFGGNAMTQPVGNCPGCGGDELFEQIHPGNCPDVASSNFDSSNFDSSNFAGECPEWACVGCGAGVFMGIVITATAATAPVVRPVRAA
jgi:hypothetical protein